MLCCSVPPKLLHHKLCLLNMTSCALICKLREFFPTEEARRKWSLLFVVPKLCHEAGVRAEMWSLKDGIGIGAWKLHSPPPLPVHDDLFHDMQHEVLLRERRKRTPSPFWTYSIHPAHLEDFQFFLTLCVNGLSAFHFTTTTTRSIWLKMNSF